MGNAGNFIFFLLGKVSLNTVHAAVHAILPELTDRIEIKFQKLF